MKIDLDALRKIAKGDPTTKVTVNRRWLAAVLSEMEELEQLRKAGRVREKLSDLVDKLYDPTLRKG